MSEDSRPSTSTSAETDDGDEPGWPRSLPADGVTESVVATLGPNDRWNFAALGLHTGESSAVDGHEDGADADGPVVTARSWGRTRTRGNFERRGEGVVQFVDDPLVFVEAALDVLERPEPVHPTAAAHVRVAVERLAEGERGGTEWVDWRLRPVESAVRRREVPTLRRGAAAVVEATVHASRLDVPSYDESELLSRLDFLAGVVESAGGERERTALERIDELVGWRDR